jgi:pilus assembly protein CpaB
MSNGGVDVPAGRRVASETVLKDVRVIAIDQQLVQGGAGGGGGEGTTRTVTLEVTPGDAERVAVATHLGKLSLAVRPVDASPNADSTNHDVTYGGDVSTALSQANKPVENKDGGSLHVYEGTTDREYHF